MSGIFMAASAIIPTAISGITSIVQKGKANKMAKNNQRPTEAVPDSILQNNEFAKLLATQGLQGATKAAAKKGIDRSATTAISQSQDRRAGVSAVGAVQQATDDANLNLSSADQQARTANVQNLMQQNQVLAGWQDKAWQWNSKGKYEENAAAIRALNTSSQENANTAVSSALSGAATAASMGLFGSKAAAIPGITPQATTAPTGAAAPIAGEAPQSFQGSSTPQAGTAPLGTADPTTNASLFGDGSPEGMKKFLMQYVQQNNS